MKKGFSLVEIIVAMTIMAIIMYAAISIFVSAGAKGVNVEVFSVAQSLAENKMEAMLSRDFNLVSSEGQTSFSGNLSSYSSQVIVNFVSHEAFDVTVGGPTAYKKIIVMIRHPFLGNPTTLESIRADN